MGVGHIAGGKHTGHVGAWSHANGLDIASLIGFNPRLEHIAVGLVTNGQEETIDGQVVALLVGLTLALDKVCALNTVLAVQAKGVVLKEHLDILGFHDTFLHHL